jgi:GT2 family glycosyltransferase
VSASAGGSAAPDVSVVIVNWNTRDFLRDCLQSVQRETTDVTFELFVVDNASKDGSQEMVRTEFPSVHLIANTENRGFAAANNQALPLARGRYCLLLNPDTVVLDGAIGKTVRIADAEPRVAVLGCQVLLREGVVQKTCLRNPSATGLFLWLTKIERLIPKGWFGGGGSMRDWDRRSARDVDVVTGMYMLVRREAIEQVGLMDEAYFVYAEEADWCVRFGKAGWRCRFTPEAQIIHRDGGGKSTSQIPIAMYVMRQKTLLIFFRKNRGRLSWLLAKLTFVAAMGIRTVQWKLVALFSRSDYAVREAACYAAALRFHLTGAEPAR